MNIKKEAVDRIIAKLEREYRDIQDTLDHNASSINRWAEEQKVLKQQRKELVELIRTVKNKPADTVKTSISRTPPLQPR